MKAKENYEACIKKVLSRYLEDSLIDSIMEDFSNSILSLLDVFNEYFADWFACKLYGEIGELYLKGGADE